LLLLLLHCRLLLLLLVCLRLRLRMLLLVHCGRRMLHVALLLLSLRLLLPRLQLRWLLRLLPAAGGGHAKRLWQHGLPAGSRHACHHVGCDGRHLQGICCLLC
jgi:hypothetical protein